MPEYFKNYIISTNDFFKAPNISNLLTDIMLRVIFLIEKLCTSSRKTQIT